MVLDYEKVMGNLKKGEYAPVYLLQGEEPFYIDQISNYIEANALHESEKGFNQTIFYGKDTTIVDIVNAARRFPMMANRQVIVVREAQDINDLFKDNKAQLLEKYVEQPLESTIFVLCVKYKKLDGRKSLYKKFEKHAVVFNSDKVKDYQLANWIEKYLRSEQFKFADNVPNLLADHLGNDLSRISNEVEKLKISLGSNRVLDDKIIQQNIGISKEYNAFELQKALLNGDEAKCYQIVRYFAANPKSMPLVVLISVLFNYFINILKTHATPVLSDAEVAKALGIHPFVAKEYIQATKVFNRERIFRIFEYLGEADLHSKGVEAQQLSHQSILMELIYKILKG
jgi:DNA polymerase-3 subunit delta